MLSVESLRNHALRPSPNGRYLERAVSGEPFFVLADTAWELFSRLTLDEAIEYLDARKKQGFNAVFAVTLAELGAKPDGGLHVGPDGVVKLEYADDFGSKLFFPNRNGDVPLLNDDPGTPNDAYFKHVDAVIAEAIRRDMIVFIVPTWSRYLNGGWAGGPILFDDDSARFFGTYIGKRYPYLPKILGGDSNPTWTDAKQIWGRYAAGGRAPSDKPLPTLDGLPHLETYTRVDAMAEGIQSAEAHLWADGLGKPLITYHPTALWLPWSQEATASSFFGDRDWLVLDGCQSGHADFPNLPFEPPMHFWNSRATHDPVSKMYAQDRVRPVIDLEPHYEDMHNALDSRNGWKWSADDIRAGGWQSVLSGACGVVYGTNGIWQMYDSERAKVEKYLIPVCGLGKDESWRQSLTLPGPNELGRLAAFFRSLPKSTLYALRPAQELLKSTQAPAEKQKLDGRIDVARADADGSIPLVIAHSGMGFAFELDLSVLGDKYTAEWYDPRCGELQPAKSQVGLFVPPSAGSVANDWVLVVEAQ